VVFTPRGDGQFTSVGRLAPGGVLCDPRLRSCWRCSRSLPRGRARASRLEQLRLQLTQDDERGCEPPSTPREWSTAQSVPSGPDGKQRPGMRRNVPRGMH